MKIAHSIEEKTLIKRSIKGDSQAQLMLYRQYVKAMYNIVIRMVANPMDAEDIIQESFVKVFKNLDKFKWESTLGAWIKRITINTTLNYIRRHKKLQLVEVNNEFEYIVEEAAEKEILYDIASIHYAIKQLPQGCRMVFNLYLLEGYQHKEIAQILNISESTSKSQYQRARRLLRKILKNK